MSKGIVIDQTMLLIIAVFSLIVLVIVYVFLSGLGGEWIAALQQAMAYNTPSP
jgi:hypothetical protein